MKVIRLTSPLVTTLLRCESLYPTRSVCRRSTAHIRTHAWMFIICCLLFFRWLSVFLFYVHFNASRQEAAQKLRMAMKFNLMWPKRWQGRVGQMTLSVTANTYGCMCACVRVQLLLFNLGASVCCCKYSSKCTKHSRVDRLWVALRDNLLSRSTASKAYKGFHFDNVWYKTKRKYV